MVRTEGVIQIVTQVEKTKKCRKGWYILREKMFWGRLLVIPFYKSPNHAERIAAPMKVKRVCRIWARASDSPSGFPSGL